MIVLVLKMSTSRSPVPAGLQDLPGKRATSGVDLREMMMRFLKNRHCGRAELARFRRSFFETGRCEVDPNSDTTVEVTVDDLLRPRTRKFLAERDELARQVEEDITSGTNAPVITGGDTWNGNSETKDDGEVKTENERDLRAVSVRTLAQTAPSC